MQVNIGYDIIDNENSVNKSPPEPLEQKKI
jgi:hypothetical protein